ncbi:MAG: YdcF family protein [Acidobacteriota bacterium]
MKSSRRSRSRSIHQPIAAVRSRTPARKSLWRILLATVVIICAVLLIAIYLAASIYFYKEETTTSADAAIVMGAAVWQNKPSPVFQERINHAIKLYHSHTIKMIIFTGGQGEANEDAESVAARQYALKYGVHPQDILIEDKSHTTFQNLYYAKEVATHRNLATFLIVSDPLHMKRSILIAHDLGMYVRPSPTSTSRYQGLHSQFHFLMRETYFYAKYLVKRITLSPTELTKMELEIK